MSDTPRTDALFGKNEPNERVGRLYILCVELERALTAANRQIELDSGNIARMQMEGYANEVRINELEEQLEVANIDLVEEGISMSLLREEYAKLEAERDAANLAQQEFQRDAERLDWLQYYEMVVWPNGEDYAAYSSSCQSILASANRSLPASSVNRLYAILR